MRIQRGWMRFLMTLRPALAGVLILATGWLTAGDVLRPGMPESVGMSTERLERLETVFQDYVERGELPGVSILVAREGAIVYQSALGFRDIEAADPMETDSIFRIASQTKAIVSVAIMMLEEEGKLLVHDPVGKYLPAFAETTVAVPNEEGEGYTVVPAERPITIRDLLTHTAGIGYGWGPAEAEWKAAGITGWYFADRDEPIAATVERMAALPFEAQPGERFVYGYSTDILGVIVETVSGQSLAAFLQERIFDPLGMEDTQFYLRDDQVGRFAAVYARTEDGGLERSPDEGTMNAQGHYVKGPRKSFSGGAGLTSTARDYAIFMQMMLNGGEYAGQRLLSPKTVELMSADHLKGEARFPWGTGMGFGLGFSVVTDLGARGEPGSLGEYGWGGAYHSSYWIDPVEDLIVVYFTQVIPADGLDDHGKLRALVYQAIIESRVD